MESVNDPQIAYALMQEYLKDLRIKKKNIHEKVSPFKTYVASEKLLNRIRENKILFGPNIWINSGLVVTLIKNSKRSCLDLFEKFEAKPNVTYLLALTGYYSIFYFQRGASILKNAICIIPSYPEKKSILDIELSEKGEIERDNYPFGWDEIDWKIYHAMRDPTRSFGKVAGELGIAWETVREHYQKILKQCRIWISFFPFGYRYYQQAFLTFKTDYELNLIEELQKTDRTSFLYKFNSTIALILYYTDYRELKKFESLKKEKKIWNFRYSRPIAWKDHF